MAKHREKDKEWDSERERESEKDILTCVNVELTAMELLALNINNGIIPHSTSPVHIQQSSEAIDRELGVAAEISAWLFSTAS